MTASIPLVMLVLAVGGAIVAGLKLLWDSAQFFKGMRDDLKSIDTNIGGMRIDYERHAAEDDLKFANIDRDLSKAKVNIARALTSLGLEQ